MTDARSLTVFCRAGLSNRLRALVSGIAVAEATGREFRMLWPRTPHCGAGFGDLFTNQWPVVDVDATHPVVSHGAMRGWDQRGDPAVLQDQTPHLSFGTATWLVDPRADGVGLAGRYRELLDELTLLPALVARVETFRSTYFRASMIDVHLRRGDFLRHRRDSSGNTGEAVAVLDRLLAAAPDAGLFLCTDDGARGRPEGVHGTLRARYGERVVSTTPRSLDRLTVAGVQDALVDLWLLRQTGPVVGTLGSTFSLLAAFGRPVECILVQGGTPSYRRMERVARVTGVHGLTRTIFRRRYGHDAPFHQAWNRLVRDPIRRRRRRH